MHPSAARRYSNLCHLQTFCPFLGFPSISEPGCQLTGEKPISQSSFFPFPWEASPPWLSTLQGQRLQTALPACTSPQLPEARAGTQGCPDPSPRTSFPPGKLSCLPHNSHQDGWEGRSSLQGLPKFCTSIPGCPQSLTGYLRCQHLPMLLTHAGSDQAFQLQNHKSCGFLTLPLAVLQTDVSTEAAGDKREKR